ncbi:cupin domain-containing protein [Paenibacillus sp. FSL L8-0436]|uniref:cupin domain-containing protein n=1 Tax=unclassified Paenibacillus TaxID=185978 RepID=UPI0031598029
MMEKKTLVEAIQYQEERFTKKILFQKGDSVMFMLNFMPGQQLPAHKHPGADVFILALKGNGIINVNDVEQDLAEGDVIHLAGDESFSYRNNGHQPASLHVVISKVPGPAYTQEIS